MAMVIVSLGFALYLNKTGQILQSTHWIIGVPLTLVVGSVIESIRQAFRPADEKRSVAPVSAVAPVSSTAPARSTNRRTSRESAKEAWDWYLKGNLKNQSGDNSGAIDCYSRAIEIDPTIWKAYCNRGTLRIMSGDYKTALADLDRAIRLEPNDALTYGSRGSARTHLGDYGGAIADYTQAIRIAPKDPAHYANRADTKMEVEDYRGAVEDCSESIRLANAAVGMPDYAVRMISKTAHSIRAKARRKLGDLRGAAEDEVAA